MASSRKKRIQQNKKNHAAKQQLANILEKKWAQKVFDVQQWAMDSDNAQLEANAQRSSLAWQNAIIELASKRQLDKVISLVSSKNTQRMLTRDAINQVSAQVGQREGEPSFVYRVWGMSMTADLPTLISMQRMSKELQEVLQQYLGGEVAVVAFIPDHVACAVTPQNLWNITTSFTSQPWSDDGLNQLRTSMQAYSLGSHIDVEKLGDDGGRGILGTCAIMVVSKRELEHDVAEDAFQGFAAAEWTQRWEQVWGQFKDTHGMDCLVGQPEQWSNAVVQAILRSTECQWSLNALLDRSQYSLLNINRVDIVVEKNDELFFEAYCGEKMFARATAPVASLLWAVHFLQHQWQRRGVFVLNAVDQRDR